MNPVEKKKAGKDFFETFRDMQKVKKYLLLFFVVPLLMLALAYLALEYLIPLNMTVKVEEVKKIPSMPFEKGSLTLIYSDKTEHQIVEDEAVFKHIASKYKGKEARLLFQSKGYDEIDTLITLNRVVKLPIRRDNSLERIAGIVKDENGKRLKDVLVSLLDMQVKTDELGRFDLYIPLEKQRDEQLVTASKQGYQQWKFAGPPSQTQDWMIILRKKEN